MSENNKKENRRYIGKIVEVESKNGVFDKITIDNIYPKTKDGEPNKYFKGHLLFIDAETGKHFKIKQIGLGGVSEKAKEWGATDSLYIDLDDEYHVDELDKKKK